MEHLGEPLGVFYLGKRHDLAAGKVSDDAILSMQRRLAKEGVWVEPASAAGLAGLAAQIQAGELHMEGKRVVVVCTGHGMKDPDIIVKNMQAPQTEGKYNFPKLPIEV